MDAADRMSAPERALAAIERAIQELIGRPIGKGENFFEAGLTSQTLVETHLVSTRGLPDPFPVTAMFAYPNLRALHRHLLDGARGGGTVPPMVAHPGDDRLRQIRHARRELRKRSWSGAGEHG